MMLWGKAYCWMVSLKMPDVDDVMNPWAWAWGKDKGESKGESNAAESSTVEIRFLMEWSLPDLVRSCKR